MRLGFKEEMAAFGLRHEVFHTRSVARDRGLAGRVFALWHVFHGYRSVRAFGPCSSPQKRKEHTNVRRLNRAVAVCKFELVAMTFEVRNVRGNFCNKNNRVLSVELLSGSQMEHKPGRATVVITCEINIWYTCFLKQTDPDY